jgi:hypothetical protein
MSGSLFGPSIRSIVIDDQFVQTGQIWRRKKDGKRVEIVWMTGRDSLRLQLRREGATNLKSTHWIDGWNLPLLYEKAEDRP